MPFIDITREFDAPRDLVFRAYTDPDLLVQWLGPRKYKMIDRRATTSATAASGATSTATTTATSGASTACSTASRRPTAMRPDLRVRGRARSRVAGEADARGARRQDDRAHHSVYQSIEARDAMVESGMEAGVNDGFDRLDDLLGRLRRPRSADVDYKLELVPVPVADVDRAKAFSDLTLLCPLLAQLRIARSTWARRHQRSPCSAGGRERAMVPRCGCWGG